MEQEVQNQIPHEYRKEEQLKILRGAMLLLYKSVKERKIREFLEEIKNGGQNEKYKGIQA